MIGFAAAIVGEIQTGGKGPLGQLALPVHTPVNPDVAGMWQVGDLEAVSIQLSPSSGQLLWHYCRIRAITFKLLLIPLCHHARDGRGVHVGERGKDGSYYDTSALRTVRGEAWGRSGARFCSQLH